MKNFLRTLCLCTALLTTGAYAQSSFNPDSGNEKPVLDINPADVIKWRVGAAQLYSNNTIEVGVQLFTEQEFTIYTDKLKFLPPPGFELVQMIAPEGVTQYDPIEKEDTTVYKGGDFKLFFRGGEKRLSAKEFEFGIQYLGCTVRICLFPYTENVKAAVYENSSTPPEIKDTDMSAGVVADKVDESSSKNSEVKEDLEARLAGMLAKGKASFWLMFAIVFIGGLLTNLTPCVAPMIPITIRLLSRQKFAPMVNSSLYAAGIMVTYTILGSVATLSGSAFGTFMQSSSVNAIFAIVMGLLGFSMIGFGNLSALQNFGARFGSGKPSAMNTFLMGAGAGLVAAPCTGPVLGALLTYTAGRQEPAQGIALMATYSLGFALPYVLLGSAAASATKVKVSPAVQITTKIVFSAIMFGLFFYYMRIPAYQLLQTLKPHMGYISVAGLSIGFVALLACVAKSSLQNNKYALLIPCLFIGTGVFAGSQWLTTSNSHAMYVYKSKEEAFRIAKEQNKPILMDNWAEWCEACKKMDVTTFADPGVIAEISEHWIMVKLDLTQSTDENDAHLEEYSISGLPTLVLLKPDANKETSSNIVGYTNAASLLNKLHEFKGK